MPSWQPTATVDTLQARAAILTQIRDFFATRDVLEVQTPLLGTHTVTDPDVEGIAVPGYGFLQTSPEYFMKRLLVAGVPSCYQLAAAFRHEEQGRLHNAEFTMLEWYRLDFDADQLMREVAELCDVVLGGADYQTVTYASLVGDLTAPRDQLDLCFAQRCAELTGRVFIIDYPADQAALARLHPDRPDFSARFELVIDGVEVANGYWELVDVADHRLRFLSDLDLRQSRGKVAHDIDQPFLSALQHGLPDCAGVALGVDRLVMRALGFQRIEDVLTFRAE
jgi:lysyl-tRNA synthetase class 2